MTHIWRTGIGMSAWLVSLTVILVTTARAWSEMDWDLKLVFALALGITSVDFVVSVRDTVRSIGNRDA